MGSSSSFTVTGLSIVFYVGDFGEPQSQYHLPNTYHCHYDYPNLAMWIWGSRTPMCNYGEKSTVYPFVAVDRYVDPYGSDRTILIMPILY